MFKFLVGALIGYLVVSCNLISKARDAFLDTGARDTIIESGVIVHNDVEIGSGCLIHSGAIIGADGFGFATVDGNHHKIPHIKSVIIGDNVEIGANCTIDRGSVRNTIINNSCKITYK